MIDAISGGALMNKTPEEVRNLIANMATNSQQFGNQLNMTTKPVNEVNVSSIEQQIASLTSFVRSMAVGNIQTIKACGICSVVGHPTYRCPTLQEGYIEQVNVASGFHGHAEWKYDPYLTMYNSGWRQHSSLGYENPQIQNHSSFQQNVQPYPPR
ncbi:hypothetical protein PTKIN_Ptkin04bG0101600 [Pterospermum kingtungense]